MHIETKFGVKEALLAYLESERKTIDDFSSESRLSKPVVYRLLDGNDESIDTLERVYSFLYSKGYRINAVKEEFLKETSGSKALYHGSKYGLEALTSSGSRGTCDFGSGFYLGESYFQALSFVYENDSSSVYSFLLDGDGNLSTLRFDYSLDWMLAICHYRKSLGKFSQSPRIQKIVEQVEQADLIIAPIADNRMFYVMSQFANGDINADVAVHSLSASNLGLQYVCRTDKALKHLKSKERLCLCQPERDACRSFQERRAMEIETKLKLAQREFRNGLFIEEILK